MPSERRLPWSALRGRNCSGFVFTEIEELMRYCGMDWEVEKRSMYYDAGEGSDLIEVPDKMVVVRCGNDFPLGVVGNGYKCVGNNEAFGILKDYMAEGGWKAVRVGMAKKGKRVFVVLKSPRDIRIGDDLVGNYLMVSTSHDGTLKMNFRIMPVRERSIVVLPCGADTTGFGLMHTSGISDKINEARRILSLVDGHLSEVSGIYEDLRRTNITDRQMDTYVKNLFPDTSENGWMEGRREEVLDLWRGEAEGFGASDKSKWKALNCVIEWIDFVRATRVRRGNDVDEVKGMSLLWGSGAKLKERALALLLVSNRRRRTSR